MRVAHLRQKLATALVLLCALLLAVDGGRVLCFGADGHIGVESLGEGHSPRSAAPTAASIGGADLEHGPCVDASLLPSPVIQAAGDEVGQPIFTPFALQTVTDDDAAALGHIAAWSLESRWRPSPARLASVGLSVVVLRI